MPSVRAAPPRRPSSGGGTRGWARSAGAATAALLTLGCGPVRPVVRASSGGRAPARPTAGPVEIRAQETRLGRILVTGQGMTIYTPDRDAGDFASTCTGPCARSWPPVLTDERITAGTGANSSWLGTIARPSGPTQAEYGGWPLYVAARDASPGDLGGQGVVSYGTSWHAVDADHAQPVR